MSRLELSVSSYERPLSYEVTTARAHLARRSGWLVRLHDRASGLMGWGEAACWVGFGSGYERTHSALRELARRESPQRDQLLSALEGLELPLSSARDVRALERALEAVSALEARAALELATLDLSARLSGLPLAQHLAHLLSLRDERPLSSLERPLELALSAGAPTHALITSVEGVERALEQGYQAFKLKVGAKAHWCDDLLLVARLSARLRRAEVGRAEALELRLDANGAWSPTEALAPLLVAQTYGVSWLEEPLSPQHLNSSSKPCFEPLSELTSRLSLPLGVDESLSDWSSADVSQLNIIERAREALSAGAQVLTLKPMFLGGLLNSAAVALEAARLGAERQRAQRAGVRVCLTHALEGAIGRRGATHLAVALRALGLKVEGGLEGALVEDVCAPLEVREGRVQLTSEPGLGWVDEMKRFGERGEVLS